MENNQNNPTTPKDDNWLDEALGTTDTPKELGPDELAVQAAGLTHPDDLELEQILSEDWDSVPDLVTPSADGTEQPTDSSDYQEPPAEEPTAPADPVPSAEDETDKTQFFTPPAVTETDTQPEEPKKQAAGPKGRPARKKGYGLWGIPHILSTLIWLLIILAIGVTLGHTLWVSCADLMAFGKPDQAVTVTISESDDIDSIAQKLKDAGLIEYPTLFKYFATLTGKDEDIEVGTFTLNSKYDYNAMINNMINYGPARDEITIMIPEGYTCAQIFQLLEDKGVCRVNDLEKHAAEGDLGSYWFLEGVKRGDKYCLEGYLFPDTYNFYTNDEPGNVLRKFLDAFDYRFTDNMREKLESIKSRTGLELSLHDVVIIASMIEKETANGAESYKISSVIFNRLNNAANFPYLNIDATLIYALGGNVDPATGNVKPLTQDQLDMEHPYNTYNNIGLPPGPISNPGRNSLDAALAPADESFYYYVYNPQAGEHIFARTLNEHEQNIRYVNSLG